MEGITLPWAARCALVALLSTLPSSAGEAWKLRQDGIGPVQVGMTLAQLNHALHEKFALPKAKDSQGCFYVKPKGHVQVKFMIEEGRVARVDVDAPGVVTIDGIQVGDAEDRLTQTYGPKAQVEPHKYNEHGHYVTVPSDGGKYGIRFETDNRKVQKFYAGKFSAIQYVEGCS